jgi:hypothetical protein
MANPLNVHPVPLSPNHPALTSKPANPIQANLSQFKQIQANSSSEKNNSRENRNRPIRRCLGFILYACPIAILNPVNLEHPVKTPLPFPFP